MLFIGKKFSPKKISFEKNLTDENSHRIILTESAFYYIGKNHLGGKGKMPLQQVNLLGTFNLSGNHFVKVKYCRTDR